MKLLNQIWGEGGKSLIHSRTIYFTLHYILHGSSWIVPNTLFEAIRKVLSLTNLLVLEKKQDFHLVFLIVKISAVFFLNDFLIWELRAVTLLFILSNLFSVNCFLISSIISNYVGIVKPEQWTWLKLGLETFIAN